MKKIFLIIIALASLIASTTTAIWYTIDSDESTTPNLQKVVDDGKELYNAVISESSEAK